MSSHDVWHIPPANQHAWHVIPRNRELQHTITHSCKYPSQVALVDLYGNCFVCGCEAWLPITVGSIESFDRLEHIWSSPTARALQQDIDAKKFSHCAVDRCGIMQRDRIRPTHELNINIDPSCNLACPSCRKHSIMHTQGAEYNQRLARAQHLVDLIEQFDPPLHIIMSGNGDPLASAIMRPLIHAFQPRPTQTIRLFTNGLLLQKQLADSPILRSITEYFVSVDAGTAQVYEQVRAPGRWENLIQNLDFLQQVVRHSREYLKAWPQVLLKFVLQQANWQDQEAFVELCQHYGFRGEIARLEDWGTWDRFDQADVIGNRLHPEHAAALAELQRVSRLWPEYFAPGLAS